MLHIYVLLVVPLGAGHMAQTGADQHEGRVAVRETAHHAGTAADFPVEPLNDVIGTDASPVFTGEIAVGKRLLNATFHLLGGLLQLRGTLLLHFHTPSSRAFPNEAVVSNMSDLLSAQEQFNDSDENYYSDTGHQDGDDLRGEPGPQDTDGIAEAAEEVYHFRELCDGVCDQGNKAVQDLLDHGDDQLQQTADGGTEELAQLLHKAGKPVASFIVLIVIRGTGAGRACPLRVLVLLSAEGTLVDGVALCYDIALVIIGGLHSGFDLPGVGQLGDGLRLGAAALGTDHGHRPGHDAGGVNGGGVLVLHPIVGTGLRVHILAGLGGAARLQVLVHVWRSAHRIEYVAQGRGSLGAIVDHGLHIYPVGAVIELGLTAGIVIMQRDVKETGGGVGGADAADPVAGDGGGVLDVDGVGREVIRQGQDHVSIIGLAGGIVGTGGDHVPGSDPELVQVEGAAGLYVKLVSVRHGEAPGTHQVAVDEVIELTTGDHDPHGYPLGLVGVIVEVGNNVLGGRPAVFLLNIMTNLKIGVIGIITRLFPSLDALYILILRARVQNWFTRKQCPTISLSMAKTLT